MRPLPADNVLYPRATNQQSISDQRAVAAPRDSFSAHDGGCAHGREFAQTLQAFLKLRLLHVIRKAAKRCIEPAHIGRIAASVAQAAERRKMRVADALRAERIRKRFDVVLWVPPGARHGANIHELFYAV